MKKSYLQLFFSFLSLFLIISCSSNDDSTSISITTAAATEISAFGASIGGNIVADDNEVITARGVCYNTSTAPTTTNEKTTELGTTGTFTSNVTGLSENTVYYTRAYVICSSGTIYGNEISFTTLTAPFPALSTVFPVAITNESYSSGGTITSDNGFAVTARGVCWNTTQHPTVTDSHSSDGSGTGSFSSIMTGLTAGTFYYFRAYATNSYGTGYGNELYITVPAALNPATKKPKSVTTTEGSSIRTINYSYVGQYIDSATTPEFTFLRCTYGANNTIQQMIWINFPHNGEVMVPTYVAGKLTQFVCTTFSGMPSFTRTFYYNSQDQVYKCTTGSYTVLYAYDAAGNVIQRDVNGTIYNMTYDSKHNPFSNVINQIDVLDAQNQEFGDSLSFPWYGNLIHNYISMGTTTISYEYDSDDFPTKRTFYNAAGAVIRTDTIIYE